MLHDIVQRPRLTASIATAALLLPAYGAGAGTCTDTTPVRHAGYRGAFDFTYSPYDGVGAHCTGAAFPARIWQPDSAATTLVAPGAPPACGERFLNRAVDLALVDAHPGQWSWVSPDLYHFRPSECAAGAIAVETSFADPDREGTPDHRGLYAAARVASSCVCGFDLDDVADGHGDDGDVVPVIEIPPPRTVAAPRPNPVDPGFVDLDVTLDDAPSWGSPAHPEVVAGYRLLYATGDEPLSSRPDSYPEVRDPADPARPLGVVPRATASATVAIPAPAPGADDIHLVVQLVYELGAATVASQAVSAHRSWRPAGGFAAADLGVAIELTPRGVRTGDAMIATLTVVNAGTAAAVTTEVWSQLGQDLAPGCLDLTTVRGLTCPSCDSVSLDVATGTLRASRARLDPAQSLTVTFQVDAGATAAACRARATATAERHRYASAAARFDNYADRNALARDASIATLVPRPDLAPLFPLADYAAPAVFPFRDEADLLDDRARPLVLYGYTGPETLLLVADRTPGVNTVRVEPPR